MAIISPLLKQAGFSRRKVAVPAIEWVAQLDGVMQFWQLTAPIQVPNNGSVELDLLYDPSTSIDNDYIICSPSSTTTSSFFIGRETVGVGSSGVVSSFSIDTEQTTNFPYDNKFHTIKYQFNNPNGVIRFIGSRFTQTQISRGIFKNFRVRDSGGNIVNQIPLTNKAQGATQLATVGNVNATMINYTEAVWKKKVAP